MSTESESRDGGGIEEGTAAESPTADLGTGNPDRERPDVAPAQLSDDAIRENAARLEAEEDGAYAEE
ncbi:hypothetical protein ACPW96_16570 [Micromonospora sp. DT81.3]|uniref:hypothetical protein n=1 Tax=Actinomycetes TaxID=1760 RepID=UPI003CF56055